MCTLQLVIPLLFWLGQPANDEASLKALQQRVDTTQVSLPKEMGRKAQLREMPVFRYSDELRSIEDAGMTAEGVSVKLKERVIAEILHSAGQGNVCDTWCNFHPTR